LFSVSAQVCGYCLLRWIDPSMQIAAPKIPPGNRSRAARALTAGLSSTLLDFLHLGIDHVVVART
jgi:hypothetical protein